MLESRTSVDGLKSGALSCHLVPIYEAWGLSFSSSESLPGMRLGKGTPELTIHAGAVPASLGPGATVGRDFEATSSAYLFRIPEVADFLVERDAGITYAPAPGVEEGVVELFLFGSAMGALLHLRGILPLHASAVEINGKAVLFTGDSGAGKSTTAYAFGLAGCPILSDDVAGIHLIDGHATVVPGLERLKLWNHALSGLGKAEEAKEPVPSVLDKFFVGRPLGASGPAPVDCMYVLQSRPEPGILIEDLQGAEKFMALQRNVYRPAFMDAIGSHGASFGVLATMAQNHPIKRLSRPEDGFSIDEVVAAVRQDLRE